MQELSLQEAYQCLKIEPGSGPLEVEKAYQQMKTLYGKDSLATYALLGEEDRQATLGRIEQAYRRLIAHFSFPDPSPVANARPKEEGEPPPVDLAASPGSYLRSLREQAGLTVREVAQKTKVSSMQLANIEQEKFERLPAPVYLRGFLLEIARALGVADGEELARLYIERQREKTREY